MNKLFLIIKSSLFILCLSMSMGIFAQSDVILKTNGDEMRGKIVKLNDKDVQFIYENETLEYTVPKTDIVKITFSSGRVEFFQKAGTSSASNVSLEDHHNKVAILPFGFLKDQETSNPTMTLKIQQETYTIFKKKAIELQYQDPLTTNALLSKAGVDNDNIPGYTMGELCDILGVEYLIQGMVTIQKTSVTNYNSTYTDKETKSKKEDPHVDSKGKIVGDVSNDKSSSSTSTTFSSSTQNYATDISMNIYTDKGDNIFTKQHQSFWQTQDAYKTTLNFLAKRTPIYKK